MTVSAPSYLRKDSNLLTVTCALLPPEEMQSLKIRETIKTCAASDLWALGIILLEMMLLENVHSSLYNYDKFSLNLSFLAKKITKAKSIYPKKFRLLNLLDQPE
jgi:serine/threonine protein kinase